MSDYISKSALIEELKEQKDDNDISCRLCMDSMIEIVENQPTLDEKEIIRKAFERVVERLEEEQKRYIYDGDDYCEGAYNAYGSAIVTVREEGGTSE